MNNYLQEIFNTELNWKRSNHPDYKLETSYGDITIYLRMNDFPDEPLFTIFAAGFCEDFDDEPRIWTIEW